MIKYRLVSSEMNGLAPAGTQDSDKISHSFYATAQNRIAERCDKM